MNAAWTGHEKLIHDWIGAVFIPNATFESLFAVVRAYEVNGFQRKRDLLKHNSSGRCAFYGFGASLAHSCE